MAHIVEWSESPTITADNPDAAIHELDHRVRMVELRTNLLAFIERCEFCYGGPSVRLTEDIAIHSVREPEAYAAVISAIKSKVAKVDAELAKIGIVITPAQPRPASPVAPFNPETIGAGA